MREDRSGGAWIVGLVVAAVLAAAAWLYYDTRNLPQPTIEPKGEEAEPAPALDLVPEEPHEEPPSAAEPARQPAQLDASDQAAHADLLDLSADGALASWLVQDEIIRKWVAAVYAASRGELVGKHRPFKELSGPLKASGNTATGFLLSSDNYQRYDQPVRLLAQVDPGTAATLYRFWYPRLAQAFGELGIPDESFHQVTLKAIDQLLAAPKVEPPIRLVRPAVYYQFADPELEKLPDMHKLMLRMGPDNAARVKNKLVELRDELVEFQPR